MNHFRHFAGVASLFLGLAIPAFSQSITLHVQDQETHSPLPYAHLEVLKRGLKSVTDAEGVWSYAGEFPITVALSYVGYRPDTVRLKGDEGTRVVSLRHMDRLLGTVVVEEDKQNLPGTKEKVTVEVGTLYKLQSETLASLLSTLPGIRVMSTGATIQKPIIEGMSGSRIQISENGVALSGQHWGEDHAPELSVPPYAKVSVIRGSESVKYGANAMGGVVVLDTYPDVNDRDTHLFTQIQHATNGRRWAGQTYFEQAPLQGIPLKYRIGYKYLRSGDYNTAEYRMNNTGSELHDVRGEGAWRQGKWSLNFSTSYHQAEMGIFYGSHIGTLQDLLERFHSDGPKGDETPFSYRINPPKQSVRHLTLVSEAGYRTDERSTVSLRYAYQLDHRREYDIRRRDLSEVPSFAFKLGTHSLTLNRKIFREHSSLEYGTTLLYKLNVSDAGTYAVPLIPNYSSFHAGLYLIGNKRLGDKGEWMYGARGDFAAIESKGFDRVGESYGGKRHFGALSASTGLSWHFTPTMSLRTQLGWGWRIPEVNELYADGIHHGTALYQVGDPNLKTEKGLKWSAGWHWKVGSVALTAHAFAHGIMDYIFDAPHYTTDEEGKRTPEVFQSLSGVYPRYFYGQANALLGGGDLSFSWDISPHWLLKSEGEWIRATNLETHGYLPMIPSDRYRQTLNYHTHFSGSRYLDCAVENLFVAKQRRFDPDLDLMPDSPAAYSLWNLSLTMGQQWENGGKLELYVKADNLFNKLYKEYTNRIRFYAHEPGRNINLGLRYSF